jgi:hypothetical protein
MRLAVSPIVTEYDDRNFKKLETELNLSDDNSSFEPISAAGELTLTKEGKTLIGGNVLTTVALSQICRTLCPGLIRLLTDLSGISQGTNRPVRPDVALQVYNSIVKTRFELLQEKSLVKNLKFKRIDGIIGAGYRQLSNKEFLDLIQDSATSGSGIIKFHRATVIGRTLVTCYKMPNPFTTEPEPYSLGLYFSNSEIGDCSVKVGQLVNRDLTDERAVGPIRRGRMIHTGKDFPTRVRRSVYTEISNFDKYQSWLTKKLKTRFAELPTKNLGFQGLDDKLSIGRMNKIISWLSRKGLSNQLAERVLYSALYQGRENVAPKKYEASIRRTLWATRTDYDLFLALIRDAATRMLSVRESEEKVAFDLLISAGS